MGQRYDKTRVLVAGGLEIRKKKPDQEGKVI